MPRREVVFVERGTRRSTEIFMFTSLFLVVAVILAVVGIFPGVTLWDYLKLLAIGGVTGYGLAGAARLFEMVEDKLEGR
jgi:hypothetical protein